MLVVVEFVEASGEYIVHIYADKTKYMFAGMKVVLLDNKELSADFLAVENVAYVVVREKTCIISTTPPPR